MDNCQNDLEEKSVPAPRHKNIRYRSRGHSYQRKEYTSATSEELRMQDKFLDNNQTPLGNSNDSSNVLPIQDYYYPRNGNRFRRTKASGRSNLNSQLADSSMAVCNDSVASPPEVDNSVEKFHQYEHPKHKRSHKSHVKKQRFPIQTNISHGYNSDNASSGVSECSANASNPRHGQIVGGRYVRKHLNLNSSSRNTGVDRKPESMSRSSAFYPPRKAYEENSFVDSDVYRYPTMPNQKFLRPIKESSVEVSIKNDATQRELLIQCLNKGECECLVCCEQIRVKGQTWHCLGCFHVFHLRCIRKWARSSTAVVEGGWRCPACQSVVEKVPYNYFCFCGKIKDPDINYHLTPHSCGEVCQRKGPQDCPHLCKELCHPGPCPPCSVVVQKSCACGKSFKFVSCSHNAEETCSSICDKPLNCGFHTCSNKCHRGACDTCQEVVSQSCFCGKSKKTVNCSEETVNIFDFSCGNVCCKQLKCKNHFCDEKCHPGDCKPCHLLPATVKFCPCGKTSIEMMVAYGKTLLRNSCKDPIPVCEKLCEKVLPCGPKDNFHRCQSVCHEGACGTCSLTTLLRCQCGACTKEFACASIPPQQKYVCARRCNRRKDCGRHKCLKECCVNLEHRCEQLCNKKLPCGNHQCQEICHIGNCPPCWNVSFDELRCHCGESVLYPPIQCGTKPPECDKLCNREHYCEHPVRHTCHSETECPPCTSLTVKWCYGHHKQCPSVMCFMEGVSCGMQCLKELPCGTHKCQLTCHMGECLKSLAKCMQPCTVPRLSCGHPCGTACHLGDCPDTPCKTQVMLMCPCGHRSETTTCHESSRSYHLMSVLATKMQDIKDGQLVNLSEVLGKKTKNKLQCNEECALIERNKRLAVALQIQNPDLSTSPGPPSYSEFLKGEARKNPNFVENIYCKISDLVQLAKESKQKCRSYAFPSMNRDQRRVVHELAEFFGCETQSYDEEPKKNVVVTAYKNKCWLPFMSIMSVVLKDMGLRKGPTPVISQQKASDSSQKKKIDYFDYNE